MTAAPTGPEPRTDAAVGLLLALADELDSEAQTRWVRVLEARESGDRDASFGERGAGDALHDAAVRIRRVVTDAAVGR